MLLLKFPPLPTHTHTLEHTMQLAYIIVLLTRAHTHENIAK